MILKIPIPIITYPITIIPRNCGDKICICFESVEDIWILFSGGKNNDEKSTVVPIIAPPSTKRMVSVLDAMFIPIPNETTNKIIDPPPNIIPRSFSDKGKNPSDLFIIETPTSRIYTTNKINAIDTRISDIFFLFPCIEYVHALVI